MSQLQRRHINLVISGIAFVIGMIAVGSRFVTSADTGVVGAAVAITTVASMIYLVIWGSRVAPYDELKRIVVGGAAVLVFTIILSSVVLASTGSAESTRAAYAALPGGLILYNTMIGFTGLIVFLGIPLAFRAGHRRINGDGGSNGGGSPEERVLSEEEFEDFDHPHEDLAHRYAEQSYLQTFSDR